MRSQEMQWATALGTDMATPPLESLDFSHSIRRSGASEVRVGTELPPPSHPVAPAQHGRTPPVYLSALEITSHRIHGDFHQIRAQGSGRPEPRTAPRRLSHHPPVASSRR